MREIVVFSDWRTVVWASSSLGLEKHGMVFEFSGSVREALGSWEWPGRLLM